VKAYLDNNVVSGIARDDNPSESDAISCLLEAYDDGRVELVTSEVTFDEIKQYHGNQRAQVERVFRLLKKVAVVRWDQLVAMSPVTSRRPLIISHVFRNDPTYDTLLSLGLKVLDARHVFVAARQSCSHFLTCDRGILHRADEIRRLTDVRAQLPSDFVSERAL
jgi:predicted nucleic acid-binding protein